METKNNTISVDKLVTTLAKYIKEVAKSLTETEPCKEVYIKINNWYGGSGKNATWKYDEICFDRQSYKFYDKHDFISAIEKALTASKVKGKVITKENLIMNGFSYSKEKVFERLMVFGKPCKEYKLLQNYLKKYASFNLGEYEVYNVPICGKRTTWSESGDYRYLDFDKRACQKAIDELRGSRRSNDDVVCERRNRILYEDEHYSKIAMGMETEWYGTYVNYLKVNIHTPTGKDKKAINIAIGGLI